MTSTTPQGIVRAQRNCCVVGCYNSETKNPDLHFYPFPGRKCEIHRKEMWVRAINRIGKYNQPWIPKQQSRVCSAHFVGGKKSENQQSIAYIPTIFPDGRNVHDILSGMMDLPFKRRRTEESINGSSFQDLFEIVNIKCDVVKIKTSTKGCQTDPWFDQPTNENNVLFCWTGGCESSTQTQIYIRQPEKPKKIIVERVTKFDDKVCGTDQELNHSLWRFLEITTDNTMRQLTGVSLEFFLTLLTLILPNRGGQPSQFRKLAKEDRLFLFLLKLKLGVSFGGLGCLFHIHSKTASRIFFEVLDTLTKKTKDWIVWPPRESVRKNIPSTFNRYPNLRCILACQETETETPSTVEQRIAMYSESKGISTIKFLIAITPDGYICQVSKGYGGTSTNRFIVEDSGFLDIIEKGDVIIADKSFAEIENNLSRLNATLVIRQNSFHNYEIDEGAKKAPAKIHVNRAIAKIKLFRILDHFSSTLFLHKENIMHICCVMANARPLVKIEDFKHVGTGLSTDISSEIEIY